MSPGVVKFSWGLARKKKRLNAKPETVRFDESRIEVVKPEIFNTMTQTLNALDLRVQAMCNICMNIQNFSTGSPIAVMTGLEVLVAVHDGFIEDLNRAISESNIYSSWVVDQMRGQGEHVPEGNLI